MKKTFRVAISQITKGERASCDVNAYLKRRTKLLVSGKRRQPDELCNWRLDRAKIRVSQFWPGSRDKSFRFTG